MGMEPAQSVEVVYRVERSDERWVLEEGDVPETWLHDAIIDLLKGVIACWAARSGIDALVGSNIALRWDERRPNVGVDPDVYLVSPAPPEREGTTSICTWKPGHHAPWLAVEVVSEHSADKDYLDAPDRYAASGVEELWVFDPLRAGAAIHGGPFELQVWRRTGARFQRVHAGNAPARSERLGAWIVVTDGGARLRIAEDREGRSLWPTAEEAERAAKENERAAKENERAAKENERTAKERAQAEAAALREEIERLRRG
jgi:Uma2 family endonuclease